MTAWNPWQHQQQTADKLHATQRLFDTSDPGTGKTAAHLLAYTARRNPGRLLVVCPKTLMRSAWGDDIEEYFGYLTVAYADAGKREAAFRTSSDVVVVNTDGVKDINPKWLKGFDHLVVDESSYFKHHNSARSKAMRKLSRAFEWRAMLSGTPNPNSVTELWHQSMLLDGGKRLGPSFHHFKMSVQMPEQVGPSANHLRWVDKPHAELAAFSLLEDILIRHQFEDVMTHVPPNHRDVKEFSLSAKAMRAYLQLEAQCLLELQDATIVGVHKAALRNKLLQLCSGAVYSEEGKYALIDTARYELIVDLIEERDHSVAFFMWKHQRDQLVALLTKRGISHAVIDGDTSDSDRIKIKTDYQHGRYQTILMHPRTGAHGLTLTRGDTTILCSPIYEADLLKQAIHRIYRGAQDKITNTILIKARGTVEELVYARLDDKTLRMDNFLDLIRRSGSERS